MHSNYKSLYPRFNDIAIEMVVESANEKIGNEEHIWFYLETILQKLTPAKERKLMELLGCKEILLLNDEVGYYARRKLAICFK